MSSPPSASDAPICDWRDRGSFLDCVEKNFGGGPLSELENFLFGEGFKIAERAPAEDFFYYQRSANDLSGYRVAIIVWADSGTTIKRIEIR